MECKKTVLKNKITIVVFSFISVFCNVLSYIIFGFLYKGTLGFANILSILLSVSPVAILLLYIFKYYRNHKASVMIPIVFGIIALQTIFDVIPGLRYFKFMYRWSISKILVLLNLVFLVFLIVATVSALYGLRKKVFVAMAMSIGLISEVLLIVPDLLLVKKLFKNPFTTEIFSVIDISSLFLIISKMAMYTAILLFGLKNSIPNIFLSFGKNQKNTPEQELQVLSDKLEFGIITKEEYQTQRAEIINRL